MDFVITKRGQEFYGLPVGDPFRGAAYGEKNMPAGLFAAIGAGLATAGGAIAAGVTAVGTFATGAVGVGGFIAGLGTIATVAGLGMSIVGMATGDQDLMKIGGIVGLAGGVGMLGGAGISSMMASSAASAAAPAASMTSTSAATGGLGGMSGASGAITPNFSSAAGQAMNAGATAAQTGTAGLSAAANAALPSSVGMVSASGVGASNAITQSALGAAGTSALSSALPAVGQAVSQGGAGIASSGGFFSDLMNNSALLNLGGNIIKGIGDSGKSDAEIALANAQATRMNTMNTLDAKRLDADIEKNKAELAQKQQQLDEAAAERQRKIDNFSAMPTAPTFRVTRG